jgi:hypothetical protein
VVEGVFDMSRKFDEQLDKIISEQKPEPTILHYIVWGVYGLMGLLFALLLLFLLFIALRTALLYVVARLVGGI